MRNKTIALSILLLCCITSYCQIKNNKNVSKQEMIRQNNFWLKLHKEWRDSHLDTAAGRVDMIEGWSNSEWVYTGHCLDSIFHRNRKLLSKTPDGDTVKCWVKVIYYEALLKGKKEKDITTYQLYQVACKSAMYRIIEKHYYDHTGTLIKDEYLRSAEWRDERPDDYEGYQCTSICDFDEIKPNRGF